MAILTDGPLLEPDDKWTAAYIRQIETAHQHAIMLQIGCALVLIVLVLAAVFVGPKLSRWVKGRVAGPVRMPDPVTRPE